MSEENPVTIDIQPGSGDDNQLKFNDFKNNKGVRFVLGFSGGADDSNSFIKYLEGLVADVARPTNNEIQDFLKMAKEQYIASIVRDVLMPLRGYRIAILTGGTKWGVPKVAAQTAKKLGFTTIGVFPLTAKNKANVLDDEDLDLKVCVHPFIGDSKWGDESCVYTELLDSVVIIGGGAGTMVEVAHLLKRNEKKDCPTKFILPIYGTGGTADKVCFFPGRPDTMAKCIPSQPLTSGKDVCGYLKTHVFLDDVFD